MSASPTPFVSRGYDGWQLSKSFMERHKYMYKTKVTADVRFRVGPPEDQTEEILAHKYMLVASSPVFEAMFDPSWSESARPEGTTSGRSSPIEIPDILPAAFNEMLR